MNKTFRPGIDIISVSGATITPEDINSVVETAQKGWFTEGEKHKAFTKELRRMLGGRSVTLCNSGSSALLLAMAAVKEFYNLNGGLVVTCATGFPTTITPAIQYGFTPYFVDINPETLNVDTNTVLELLNRDDVVGVILAHTLGFPYDAPKIAHHISTLKTPKFFIEDCADALGASIRSIPVGVSGDASTFSFFPAHHITTGEGGAVSWFHGRLAKIGNSYASWGRDCWCKPGDSNTCNKRFYWEWDDLPCGYDHKYTFTRLGYNLKMTELQAALGLSQLSRLSNIIDRRIENFYYLYVELLQYAGHLSFVQYEDHWSISPFGFPITVTSSAFTRKELVEYLELNRIATRPIFAGNLVRQPMMKDIPFMQTDLSGSDFVMNNSFWVGCHDGLDYNQLNYMLDMFKHFFRSRGL